MEQLNYITTKVFTKNNKGELIQKRIKATEVCPGLLMSLPKKDQCVDFIVDYNGVKFVELHTIEKFKERYTRLINRVFKSIEEGMLLKLDNYHKEIHRRIFTPESTRVNK